MESRRIVRITGTGVAVRGNDIDTDRIVPARYLKEVTFERMGEYPFIDERFDETGNARQHPFNDPRYRGASILLVNANFGCGSSREHAPQALLRWGIRAIVGESFAEIFAGNSLAIGLPVVTAAPADVQRLMDLVGEDPTVEIAIDLEQRTLTASGKTAPIGLPETVRVALTQGYWDSTAVLASNADKVRQVASRLPYLNGFPAAGAR
ncbi:MAG TPA: 3-isopropylmalate dehydratase small subunit [Chloroflexota bacterium]|nr:3-isopropylmalate dehydratase small subunit [Chloroflexota bacterium]